MNIPTAITQIPTLFKVKLSDLMNIYLIQNPNKMKANYEEKDILAVIEKEILNIFKRIKIALSDF